MTGFADRVKETTVSTGTGNISLAGAVAGFQSFNTAFGTNVQFEYTIEAVDGSGTPTGDWEVGSGYLSASTTLVRDIIKASSNSNSAVNLSSGTKNVFCTFSAQKSRQAQRAFDAQYGLP